MIFVKVPVSSIADGKPPLYKTESKPYMGGKSDGLRGGFPTMLEPEGIDHSESSRNNQSKFI